MLWTRRASAAACAASALAVTSLAAAFWSGAGAAGSGSSSAGSLPPGPRPVASAARTTIALTWSQLAPRGLGDLGAAPGGGYVVTRYAEGGGTPIAPSPGSGCAGVVVGGGGSLSCSEADVPEGRWEYTVTPRLGGWFGAEGPRSPAVHVDVTPPATAATVAPAPNAAGWSSAPVTVSLASTDNPGGSGVAATTYWATGAQPVAPTSYAGPFTISADGTSTVAYRAVDAAGNAEATSARTIRVDSGTPTGSLTAPATGSILAGIAPLASSSADAVSGVASAAFEASAAGSSSWSPVATATAPPYAAALDTTMLADGAWLLRVVTTDRAGNTTISASVAVIVDNALPRGTDIQGQNEGVAGTIDAGDTLTYTFSEPMLAGSIAAGWSGAPKAVTVRVQNGGGTGDRLTVPAASLGTVRLGARSWITSGTATFAGTIELVTPSTLTLTVGACTSGCGNLATGVGPATLTWTPSSAATDLAGNGMVTAVVTQTDAPRRNL